MPAPVSVRRKLAPVAATALALAVGIAVGAGPLSDVGTGSDQLAAPAGAPALTDASALEALDAADELAARAAPELYADALADTGVALVVMPGADRDEVAGLRRQVAAAGADVTGTWQVGTALTDPRSTALVDSLGRRLLEQQPNLPVDADAPTYERAGALLGTVVASTQARGQQAAPATTTVAETLRTAELVEGPADPRDRAPLVLVVLGAERTPDPAADAVLSGLLSGLASRSVGTVVAAGTASATDGTLARLRETGSATERGWSSVDGVERVVGRVVTGLAVVQAAEAVTGDWGVSGSDGVLPRPGS